MRNLLKFFLSKENLLASIFLIILLFYFFSSLNLEKTIGEDVVGPSSFPIIISLIGAFLILFLFLQNFKKKNKVIDEKNNSIKQNINKLSPILITIIFVLTFELIGFIFSSLIYSFLFIYYLNRNFKIALIFSIFITFVIFILFYFGLNFQMPMGTLINTDEIFPFLKAIKKSIY